MGVPSLAHDQWTTELVIEAANALSERRLGDVAPLCRAREVQLRGEGEEVLDLMHLHGAAVSGQACGPTWARHTIDATDRAGVRPGRHRD